MSRHDHQRLADILAAAAAIEGHLAHRYFDTAHSVVQSTIKVDLPPLVAAVQRLLKETLP